MEEIITVKLNKNDLYEAIRQYLKTSGYQTKDNDFKFRIDMSNASVSGVIATVLNSSK